MRIPRPSLRALTILACGILIPGSCKVAEEKSPESHDPEFRPVKLYYENSTGEVAITTYYYDINGRNYLAHWQLEDSSRSSINYHEHDTSENQIRKYREFSDGLTSDQHFFFDAEGKLVREDYSRSDGVEGKTGYEYDDQGRCIAARCKGLKGWFHGDLYFLYDGVGLKTGAGIYREGDSIGFIEYSYDDHGNLTREYWDFNGQWTQTFCYEYQKEADQTFTPSSVFIAENRWFRVKEGYYNHHGETGGPFYYHYNDEGRLIGKEYIPLDGLSTRTTYCYDSTGLLLSSLREYPDGISEDFHYWYGIDRNLLVRTFERSDGGRGSGTYRYDEQGRLVSGEWVNADIWLTGTLTFEYDETGLLRTGKFVGDDGFDADLQFEYDLNHNLVAINWAFAFGGFQTYHFIYEPV